MPILKVNNIDVPSGWVYEDIGTVMKIYKNKVDIAINPNLTGNPIHSVKITPEQRSLLKVGQKINYTVVIE